MLLCVSCHGVVGNLCNFPLFKQAGAWGEKQNQKLKKYMRSTYLQVIFTGTEGFFPLYMEERWAL